MGGRPPARIPWRRIALGIACLACAALGMWWLARGGGDETTAALPPPHRTGETPHVTGNVVANESISPETAASTNGVRRLPKADRLPAKISRRLEEMLAANPEAVEVTVAPMSPEALPALEAFVREQGGTIIPSANGRMRLLRAKVSPAVLMEEEKATPFSVSTAMSVVPPPMSTIMWPSGPVMSRWAPRAAARGSSMR